MKNIKHSIVIVSFNQEKYIVNAIKSIFDQQLEPYELIVLDDCSTDGTAKVAHELIESYNPSFKCRVIINERNLGIPKNMKKAAEVSSGNVFSLLAADDIFLPNATRCVKNAIQKAGLDPDHDVFVCFSPSLNMDADGKNQVLANYKIYRQSPFQTMIRKCAPFGKIGFSRSSIINVDYPDDIGIWADWAWDISICNQANSYYVINEICYIHYAKIGVSSKTANAEIDDSYLKVTIYLMNKYKNSLSFFDRIYLEGERAYLSWKINRGFLTLVKSILFTLVNIFNSGSLSSSKSLASRFLHSNLINAFRKSKEILKLLI
ncbi:glycosyltransferase family 2 protein [Polynucleobacter sp. AP-Capit-er-40B-B4]|uniref:glycosyltransferase family 2 protein n=1 Tax=Polynucleobacter sp. AP-Capit-er-40B-B4 TaxID=2576927 RepID=UPI001C0C90BA|nr:glycosyltransferase family 2 protein [Polynucleobacter sp. AP-Capit-er-40B-B4]MBU3580979.1 glycosyltransferase family 2 protein [Polynucleobacter sp. AP-Capit-er-40B-B4]